MNPDAYELVQESWPILAAVPDRVARRFYEHLFAIAPQVRPLFADTNFDVQRRKFFQMLDELVAMLDQPERAVPVLAALGRQHVGYGAEPSHYDAVGAALLATLDEILGDAFTPPVREAWSETYRVIAGVMRRAAEEPSADATP